MKIKKRTIGIIIGGIVLAILIPFLLRDNRYYMDVFIMLGVYVILGSAMNLLIGFTGQISLGMGAFYGIGAYAAALLSKNAGLPFGVSLIVAVLISFAVGYVLGLPSTRLGQIFLAITTAGLNTIIVLFITNTKWTGGASGLTGIPAVNWLSGPMSKIEYYYMVLIFVLLVLLMLYHLVNSKTGRALKAIRGNPIAASSVAINVNRYKLLVFAIASALAGLAGVLYAFNIRFIQADAFSTNTSIKILTMGVIGGMGDLGGGVLGSLVVGVLPELLRDYARYQLAIYGLLIVLVLRFMPRGIVYPIQRLFDWIEGLFRKKGGGPPDKEDDSCVDEPDPPIAAGAEGV